MNRRHWLRSATLASLPLGAGLMTLTQCRRTPQLDLEAHAGEIAGVVNHHAEVCFSAYTQAWQAADKLRAKIAVFLKRPSAKGFAEVREHWKDAVLAYAETEGLRAFASPADSYHPRIQSWPVEPSHFDTVPGQPKSGLVHQPDQLEEITAEGLIALHQPSGGKVTIGLHALEFLIYGNDLYDDGGGYRAYTDYTRALGAERRRQLLQVLAEQLSADIKQLTDAWHPSQQGNFRSQFLASTPNKAMGLLFTGLIHVCANGLDGKLTRALKSGDQKDEVCNYSDLSLEAIRHAILGLQKTLNGEAPGRVIAGEEKPLLALIAKASPELSQEIASGFEGILGKLNALDPPFDQLIKPENAAARQQLEAVAADLEKQKGLLEKARDALGATLKSSAS